MQTFINTNLLLGLCHYLMSLLHTTGNIIVLKSSEWDSVGTVLLVG